MLNRKIDGTICVFRTAIFRRPHTCSGRSSSTGSGRRRRSSTLGGRYRYRRRRLPAPVRRQRRRRRRRRVGNVDRRRRQSMVGGGRVEQIGKVPSAAVVVFFVAEQQVRGTGRPLTVLLRALPPEVLASRRVRFAAPRRRFVRRRRGFCSAPVTAGAAAAAAVRPVQAQPIVGFPRNGRGGRSPRLGHPPVPAPGTKASRGRINGGGGSDRGALACPSDRRGSYVFKICKKYIEIYVAKVNPRLDSPSWSAVL